MSSNLLATAFVLALVTGPLAAGASSSQSSAPARYALLIGGSGEDETENFLIEDLRGAASRLRARGWAVNEVAGSKDGLLSKTSVRSTRPAILAALKSAVEKSASGDELLVLVHSHGREREREWGQLSHSIVSEDRDLTGGEPGFDLDSLDGPLTQARRKGVHVGLVDLSCYSGESQALKGPSCTVSLASPGYVSMCSGRPEERHFSSRFLSFPKPGESATLEGQYFAARDSDLDSVNLPQISSRSTPALAEWDALLRNVDPLDVYEDLKYFRAGPKPFQIKRLLGSIDDAIAALPETRRPIAKAARKKIERLVSNLLALRARMERDISAMAAALDTEQVALDLPGRDTIQISPGNLAEVLDRAQHPDQLEDTSDAERSLISAVAPLRTQLAKQYAMPLEAFRKKKASFDSKMNELSETADQVMAQERELYDAASAQKDQGECALFAL